MEIPQSVTLIDGPLAGKTIQTNGNLIGQFLALRTYKLEAIPINEPPQESLKIETIEAFYTLDGQYMGDRFELLDITSDSLKVKISHGKTDVQSENRPGDHPGRTP